MTIHHISEQLDIEEHWTEEQTPQLKEIRIVDSKYGIGVAGIQSNDLEKAIETLQQIQSDKAAQRTLKHRRETDG